MVPVTTMEDVPILTEEFRVGRRTSYWIVYSVDEDAKTFKVLRFWNASKEPAAFEL